MLVYIIVMWLVVQYNSLDVDYVRLKKLIQYMFGDDYYLPVHFFTSDDYEVYMEGYFFVRSIPPDVLPMFKMYHKYEIYPVYTPSHEIRQVQDKEVDDIRAGVAKSLMKRVEENVPVKIQSGPFKNLTGITCCCINSLKQLTEVIVRVELLSRECFVRIPSVQLEILP